MQIIASALAAIIPMTTYLILIWRFDRYDREPFKLVLQNYLWGSIGAIIFALIGGLVFSTLLSSFVSDKIKLEYLGTVVTAPIVEEITKGIFLLITVTNRKFDNMTDGIVYGGAIGLGFGMTENFLYFISFGTTISGWIALVIIRTLFSAVMHCVTTATFGAFLGYAKFKRNKFRFLLPFAGLLIAMFIHFLWNFMVSFQSTALLGFLFLGITIIIFIAIFSASVLGEKKIIFNELLPEVNLDVIPETHLTILSSTNRNSKGWVDERIRKQYIKAATTLAFRKSELKYSKGNSKRFYEYEVELYRQFIKNLFASVEKPKAYKISV